MKAQTADNIALAIAKSAGILCPPPEMTLSQWADEFAYLSAESAATHGKWLTLPYQRGIMDAITDPRYTRVSVMKSARVGYTKIVNHAIAYHVHYDPCPIMVVQPTIEDAEGYSKDEIAPMMRDTPCLKGLFYEGKGRGSRSAASQTILKKTFAGGNLLMVGANSARGFRRVSVRVLVMDEVDGYPASAGDEGDQEKLAEMRTQWYHNRKIIKGSTPTLAGVSRIEKAYKASSKGRYFVPCPHCRNMHSLEFENLKWPQGNPERAYFVCRECGAIIEHADKFQMIERGEWRHERADTDHAGFFIWTAYSYSPNATWGQIATEYEEARAQENLIVVDGKTVNPMQVFENTVLGIPHVAEEQGEKLEVEFQRETYPAQVPAGGLLLCAGVDVQKDRLEATCLAFGHENECWAIEHRVFLGDTSLPTKWTRRDYAINPWRQLDDWLKTEFKHESGNVMRIASVVVDSSAFTQHVYRYCADRFHRNVFAGKGIPGEGRPIVDLSMRTRRGKRKHLILVGTFAAKDLAYNAFPRKPGTPGSVHWPDDEQRGFNQEYFDQLTSERKVLTYRGGKMNTAWTLPVGLRNEALDCFVYAMAAMYVINPVYSALEKRLPVIVDAEKTEEKVDELDKIDDESQENSVVLARKQRFSRRKVPYMKRF